MLINEMYEEIAVEEIAVEEADETATIIETEIGETEIGLPLFHYCYYDAMGNIIGEAEDIPNSVGGYDTVRLWGNACGKDDWYLTRH